MWSHAGARADLVRTKLPLRGSAGGAASLPGGCKWPPPGAAAKAEAYVILHPEGVRTADVATAIGQDVKAVDGTLRQVTKRGTVYYDKESRAWYPSNATSKKGAPGRPKYTAP